MSLLLDSEAQLEARAKEIGLADEVIAALQNAGVKNMSQLAFAVGQPGEPLSNQEIDRFLANVLSRPAVLAESTGVRRLAFEAQTFVIASLRQVIEQKDDGAPKKIGAAERETRMNAIKLELGGLSISDDNEPSHALLERACQIFETNTLKYLEPAICTSRAQEVQGGTKSKELSFEGGSMIIKDKDDKLVAPTSSELQFLHAMTRRGIALKFAKLMTFDQRSQWTNFLLQTMQREPPPGYSRPSLHQVMMCDKAAFTKLGTTMGTVRPPNDTTFPLGTNLLALRNDPMIALHLVPLARLGGQQNQNRTGPYHQQQPSGRASQPSGAERKGKGKGKKGKTPSMPQEFEKQMAPNGPGRASLLCLQHQGV